MRILSTPIPDLTVAETIAVNDDRGSFLRLYCEQVLSAVIGDRKIAQINHSQTKNPGVIRGMHFQTPPHSEMKLVRCIKGRVWDVAVDLRFGSSTFLKWHGLELSPENKFMIIIPEGFAHGFQSLEPESELIYLHTSAYHSEAEVSIHHADPRLNIRWPLPVTGFSPKDAQARFIDSNFRGLIL